VIMGMGLALARYVEQSYSRNLAYEKMVNAENREVTVLVGLALAAAPQDPSLDDAPGPAALAQVQYAAGIFLDKTRGLLKESEQLKDSPLARSRPDLRSLIADMNELVLQQQLASEAALHGDAPQLRAHFTYAERVSGRLNTTLGNIREEIAHAKDDVISAETLQLHRVRSYLRPLFGLGLLFVLPAVLYARSLGKHIWAYETQLETERNTLEDRVATRTAALRGEIVRRTRIEVFNHDRNRLLEMVVGGKGLEEVIAQLADAAEQSVPGSRCLISLGAGESASTIAPQLEPSTVRQLLPLLEASGPGFAAADKKNGALFITDADTDLSPAYAEIWSHGFRALFAVPVTERPQEVLGWVVLLLNDNGKPDAFVEEMLLSAGRLAAVALAHYRMQRELFRRAHHDALTDLPNRILFEDRLQQAIARAQRRERKVAVLCIDLDEFKQINDQHGHETGDRLLQEVASRLSSRLRTTDTVARIGGDEFLAVIEDLSDTDTVATVAESLLRTLGEPFSLGNTVIRATASIGVAVFPADGTTIEELKRHADLAMYRAKERGRNTYEMFSAVLSQKLARRREIERCLREALQNDGFELYYQPIYTVARELVGVEALLRFRNPEWKAISPGEFIPVAEQSGLISEIGEWVLKEVCRQGKQWQEEGLPPIRIAVNVSAIQLGRTDFAAQVTHILRESGFPPEYLQIEVTETAMMSDAQEGGSQLYTLEAVGAHISIDDFGTGHSSLSYIHNFPIDTLKIDRSFVQQIVVCEETKAIVRAITAMAQALGLKVVAEGVETQAQLNAAAAAGCEVIQGYLFARPLPQNSIRAVLQKEKYGNTGWQSPIALPKRLSHVNNSEVLTDTQKGRPESVLEAALHP
jgi:diguanylate cyclase (GGDEF)-like protein